MPLSGYLPTSQFTVEMCRAAGFTPTVYRGTVESIRAAADLVAQGRCLYCVPSSCIAALPGTIWRPLTQPASCYPWSVLWRAADTSPHVQAVVSCAQAMSKRLGWLTTAAGHHSPAPVSVFGKFWYLVHHLSRLYGTRCGHFPRCTSQSRSLANMHHLVLK